MRKFKQDIVKHECRGVQQCSGGAEIENGNWDQGTSRTRLGLGPNHMDRLIKKTKGWDARVHGKTCTHAYRII
jgi:hypothetical protein